MALCNGTKRSLDLAGYSIFLQNISHASAIIAALFVPRIRAWVTEIAEVDAKRNNPHSRQNLRQAIEILLRMAMTVIAVSLS